jgi:hypothetical protein
VKKPNLEDKHINGRLKVASNEIFNMRGHKKNIIFIDEKLFNFTPSNNLKLVRRKKNQRFNDKHMTFTSPRSSHKSINSIAWIGPKGLGGIYVAEHIHLFDKNAKRIKGSQKMKYKGFDNLSFLHVFEHQMLPDIMSQYGLDFVIMVDNAGIHNKMNNKTGKQYFDELLQKYGIQRVYWEARSPDMNPIEHLHKLVQASLYALTESSKVKNKEGTFKLLRKVWDELDNQTAIDLHKSFKNKCLKVLKNNGRNTFDG